LTASYQRNSFLHGIGSAQRRHKFERAIAPQ
jgi:hypothetical protein